MIAFEALERPNSGNDALFADAGDTRAEADEGALRMRCTPAEAIAHWDAVVRDQSRTRVIESDRSGGTHHAVQASRIFRFKDDVYARAVPDGQGGARLMLYSASRLGKGDLGVNARRLKRWRDALRARLAVR